MKPSEVKVKLPISGPGTPFYLVKTVGLDGLCGVKAVDKRGRVLEGIPVVENEATMEAALRKWRDAVMDERVK